MKSEGLHGRKGGTSNLDIHARKKSEGGSASPKTMSIAEGQQFIASALRQKKSAGEAAIVCQLVEDNAFHPCKATLVFAAR
jgi:hypothetical protein